MGWFDALLKARLEEFNENYYVFETLEEALLIFPDYSEEALNSIRAKGNKGWPMIIMKG